MRISPMIIDEIYGFYRCCGDPDSNIYLNIYDEDLLCPCGAHLDLIEVLHGNLHNLKSSGGEKQYVLHLSRRCLKSARKRFPESGWNWRPTMVIDYNYLKGLPSFKKHP